ncbi:integrase arm-type DNA-binding domain-containing protein [Nostoc ellipsosporum NOK]|nr:integrase arm-type DNA-binding domain-containing protein [Nostoc ellipsosporum NOK]
MTVAQVRNARPGEKPYKLADSGGLYLFVTSSGAKSWRLKYRIGGKEKVLTFGLFPDVSLVDARDRRDEVKRQLRAGVDPGAPPVETGADDGPMGPTFQTFALGWHEAEKARWSPGQAKRILFRLERDVFPGLGKKRVADITGPDILRELRKIEDRGSIETAKRVRGWLESIFKRAKGEHLITVNPAIDIADGLRSTPKGAKQPALTSVAALLKLQAAVDRSTSGPAVKLASRLLALTGVRIGALRTSPWDGEITGIDWSDPDAPCPDARWIFPAERMKLEVEDKGERAFDHDVPLSAQAVEALRALRVLSGRGTLMFPNARDAREPLSDSAVSTLYKRLGYKGRHVPHGWRAAFSTIMNEWVAEHGKEGDRLAIDIALAHVPEGMSASEFAYNRARYAKRRRELLQVWADMISDGLCSPFDLVRGHER